MHQLAHEGGEGVLEENLTLESAWRSSFEVEVLGWIVVRLASRRLVELGGPAAVVGLDFGPLLALENAVVLHEAVVRWPVGTAVPVAADAVAADAVAAVGGRAVVAVVAEARRDVVQ